MLFTFILLLVTPSIAAALILDEATKIPYQVNNSDRIIIGSVSGIDTYYNYTIFTITVKEWLYNSLPTETIKVRTESGTNFWTEDEVELAQNESALLMLKDENLDKKLFRVPLGLKYSVSDRDEVIKELKAQGKWQENSGNNYSENVDTTPQSLPLTFGPGTFDKLKKDPNFIASYGSIPTFATSEERKQWLDKLETVYQMVIPEMSKYEYPNGPVIAFGYSIDGVLDVGVNKTVEKPLMDEIYQIFDSNASLIGIKEVPVVFMHEDPPVPTILYVKETANLSESEEENSIGLNNKSSENTSNENKTIPEFGLLGGLTCLYGGVKLRKK
jgi:hypothetical protein